MLVQNENKNEKSQAAAASRRRSDFDPFIGSGIAMTWWRFGTSLSKARLIDPDSALITWDDAELEKWLKEFQDEMGPRDAKFVSKTMIKRFVETTLRLLEAKYDGKPIAAEVKRLVRQAAAYQCVDVEGYLEMDEPGDCLLANEYRLLFLELGRPRDESGKTDWRRAVGRCEQCHRFYVKQRLDQRFDTAKCRVRYANKKSPGRAARANRRRG